MYLVVLIAFFYACNKPEPVNNADPRDLTMTVILPEDGSGNINIEASAINAIRYTFHIDDNDNPIEENITGRFTYSFIHSGIYVLEVRAYGTSGRYVKEVRHIELNVGKDVSIEDGYQSPLTYEGYDLVWNDEFEGNVVNHDNWSFEIGTGCPNCGWGNNELEYYRRENAWVGEGILTIEARKQRYEGSDFTSARLVSRGHQTFKYGRIDIRALLPKGQGMWPALWLLGTDFISVGWPECGEIDIMEMVGGLGREKTTNGTLHWGIDGTHAQTGGSYTLPSGILADEYHVFSIVWDKNTIIWYFNNEKFYTVDITPSNMSEFHNEFFLIMNLAVGGNWPGSPDSSTVFPQSMKVDFIRVFQTQN